MKGTHRTYHDGYSICYWRDNTACGYDDDWKEARFEVNGVHRSAFVVETHAERDDLMRLLERVFTSGKYAKLQEIKQLLEIKS